MLEIITGRSLINVRNEMSMLISLFLFYYSLLIFDAIKKKYKFLKAGGEVLIKMI